MAILIRSCMASVCFAILAITTSHAADITLERSYDGRDFDVRIVGPIQIGDDEKFTKTMLNAIGLGLKPAGVTIYSPGGAVLPAMEIGRQIRLADMFTSGPHRNEMFGKKASFCLGRARDEYGRNVAGGKSEFSWSKNLSTQARRGSFGLEDTRENPGCVCASACFLIWSGGVARVKAVIGVHRPYFDKQEFGNLPLEEAMVRYDAMSAKVKDYLKEMDVPDRIIRKMMTASSEDMLELSDRDLEDLDNTGDGGEGYHELQLAKCGSAAAEIKTAQRHKTGAPCNSQCQADIKAMHQKMKEVEVCYQQIRDQEGPSKGADAYVARYGSR